MVVLKSVSDKNIQKFLDKKIKIKTLSEYMKNQKKRFMWLKRLRIHKIYHHWAETQINGEIESKE